MVEQGGLTNYKVYGIDEVGPIFTFSMKARVYNGLASARIIARICSEYRDAAAFEFKERAWRAVSAKLHQDNWEQLFSPFYHSFRNCL